MKTKLTLLVLLLVWSAGCRSDVPQGTRGRIKTASGWQEKTLAPGRHACWGFDQMYLVQTTQFKAIEKINVLVGGKVNLSVDITVRGALRSNENERLQVFETLAATDNVIDKGALYSKFLAMKVQAVPRNILGSQLDIKSVLANRSLLNEEIKRGIIDASAATPIEVYAIEVTNYDWPRSITAAQEALATLQLAEEQEAAKIRAELKRAEGALKIAEADKLVELKKAETVAESIDIIRQKLAGNPEYLRWHEIRMLSEAAKGPNNAFIIVPYGQDMQATMQNAQLSQLLTK